MINCNLGIQFIHESCYTVVILQLGTRQVVPGPTQKLLPVRAI